jgi:uncharacterized protein YbjT (DUF2867 family)
MIAITGATGNTGSAAAEALLAAGEKVRVIGRSADKLKRFTEQGAEAFVGDVLDTAAMTRAFSGASAVYAMIPPDFTQEDFLGYQLLVSDSLAAAIEAARVEYVVSLSSVGAQLPEGAGPISGLHHFEQRLNRNPGQDALHLRPAYSFNVLHLRPAYFFENFLMQIPVIGMLGAMAGILRADLPMAMIATRDIGARAAQELRARNFTGQGTRELLGPREYTLDEAAAILGRAIGRPDLRYVQAPPEQVIAAMRQMGLSADGARLIAEMYLAFNEGKVRAEEQRSAENTTPTTLEAWAAEVFAPAVQGRAARA